ncbi:hypothetical protein VTG60DRAFT_884 [Thermothelomyces hinnuleus]
MPRTLFAHNSWLTTGAEATVAPATPKECGMPPWSWRAHGQLPLSCEKRPVLLPVSPGREDACKRGFNDSDKSCGSRGHIRKRPPWADLAKNPPQAGPLTLPDAIAIATSAHAANKLRQLQLQRTATGNSRVGLTRNGAAKDGVGSLNPGVTGPAYPPSIPEAKQPLASPQAAKDRPECFLATRSMKRLPVYTS